MPRDLKQELKEILEDLSEETFYTYSFVIKEPMPGNQRITNRFKIAVKVNEKFYDVISSVPLTTDIDSPLATGIRICEVEEASEEEIKRVADNLAYSFEENISYYKQLMQRYLEHEDEMRRRSVENRGRLLRLVQRIGRSDK